MKACPVSCSFPICALVKLLQHTLPGLVTGHLSKLLCKTLLKLLIKTLVINIRIQKLHLIFYRKFHTVKSVIGVNKL